MKVKAMASAVVNEDILDKIAQCSEFEESGQSRERLTIGVQNSTGLLYRVLVVTGQAEFSRVVQQLCYLGYRHVKNDLSETEQSLDLILHTPINTLDA